MNNKLDWNSEEVKNWKHHCMLSKKYNINSVKSLWYKVVEEYLPGCYIEVNGEPVKDRLWDTNIIHIVFPTEQDVTAFLLKWA